MHDKSITFYASASSVEELARHLEAAANLVRTGSKDLTMRESGGRFSFNLTDDSVAGVVQHGEAGTQTMELAEAKRVRDAAIAERRARIESARIEVINATAAEYGVTPEDIEALMADSTDAVRIWRRVAYSLLTPR